MSKFHKTTSLGLCALAMFCMDITGSGITGISLVSEAAAIIGRPATPVSVAGVARRNTVGVVAAPVAATAVVATTVAVAASTPAPVATLAVGSAVAVLPGGCTPATIGGVAYSKCGNVYYRAAYQGNNLVYIVSAP